MSKFVNPFDEAGFSSKIARIPPPSNDPDVDVTIFYRHFIPTAKFNPTSPINTDTGTKKPLPIILLHGHPQTHVIWSTVATSLASSGLWEIVIPDNRGNGSSSAPCPKTSPSPWSYSRYSKREMARDMVEVMTQLGHERFYVVAHDRGARIAHRLALDWPEKVIKMILLDIAPTLDMYSQTEQKFASAYWHWFFLLQPDLPEAFIEANPKAYLHALVTRFPRSSPTSTTSSSTFSSELEMWRTNEYLINLSRRSNIIAMCEDYRASSPLISLFKSPDLELDQSDRENGRKIQCETKILWGKQGIIQAMYKGGLYLWQQCCEKQVKGQALDCGHYIPEEAPQSVVQEIQTFFFFE
ncbi:related to haloacetate dehalogenase H-1 [Melanopsichium pennsylvanicum]|uniref:Related to haloacetate dehalogenase H-1 n=2 Tax=Melanopsichium pennsylvanicum TaxID=63383 RepID=A0AAJ4XPS4_9BASI|nr:alpha beta hydrolase [Melanopsichium pennsylvanicum 4]SNX86088.1 related to haloacetate dehalogenase H-1 [Melanopsichium pennsylvanicum]